MMLTTGGGGPGSQGGSSDINLRNSHNQNQFYQHHHQPGSRSYDLEGFMEMPGYQPKERHNNGGNTQRLLEAIE